jgi:hypothetical protein
MAYTLSDLDRYAEAKNIASDLYRSYPYDFHVRELNDALRVKEMFQVTGDARFINEAPGTTEYRFRLMGSQTIKPAFSVFAGVLHMQDYENQGTERFSTSWDRFDLGFGVRIIPGLLLTQSGGWDYVAKTDFGSTTRLTWNAGDHLRVTAAFESFSLDIPLRARVTGVTGKTGLLDLHYHENDLREYGLVLYGNWLSDGNSNPAGLLRAEQTIAAGPGWRLLLGPELYYARYSKSQEAVPYFSPEDEASFAMKPVLQLTHHDLYDRSFKSYIYGSAGVYKEHGYGTYYPVGGIAYGQEWKMSRTFSLRWMAGYDARVYDGRYSNVLELFLTLQKYF